MKKRLNFKWFSIILSLIVMFLVSLLGLKVIARENVLGNTTHYIGYTDADKYQGNNGDFAFYIKKENDEDDDKFPEVVFCFNANLHAPKKSSQGGTIYERQEIITNDELKVHAKNIRNDSELQTKIKSIIQAYKDKTYKSDLSDSTYRRLTQLAVWYYTDSYELSSNNLLNSKHLSDEEKNVYEKLKAATGGDNISLHMYKSLDSNYQNLLGTDLTDKEIDDSGTEITLIKKDKTTKKFLAGAQIDIVKGSGYTPIYRTIYTTGDEKKLAKITLQDGEYRVMEKNAPVGYKNSPENSDGKVIKIENGKLYLRGNLNTTNYQFDYTEVKNLSLEFENEKDVAARTELTVNKYWIGQTSEKQAKIQLYKNGKKYNGSNEKYKDPVVLTENTYKFENLEVYDSGEKERNQYTVKEVDENGDTISSGETISLEGKNYNVEIISNSEKMITINNRYTEPIAKDLYFSKVNVGGKEIAGAQIEIQQNGRKIVGWTSESGKSHAIPLAPGEYVFHEVTAPTGYKVVTDITFTVDKDGNVAVVKDTTTGTKTVVEGNKLVITDEIVTHSVEISKQNIAGENLANAKVTVTDKSGNVVTDVNGTKVEQFVTTKDNLKLQLPAGEYTFVEDAAPAGYDVVSTFKFTVDTNGKVTTTSTDAKTNGSVLTVVDQATKYPVEISKQNIAGENLANAKVTVTDKSGNVVTDVNGTKVEQFVTTKDNLKLQLPAGEYTFVEDAAPAGYDVVSTFKFTVDTNGKVTTTSTDAKTNGSVLTVVDQATKVVPKEFKVAISKVGLGGVELAGADVTVTKDGQEVDRWTSTTTSHELTLTEGTYVFHEISAPNGYKVVTDITFTVDKDGNVAVVKDTTTGTKTVVEGNKLVITDETTAHDVLFSKTDLGGSEIAGAQIEIRDTANNLVASWTSEAGVTKQVSLNEGTYTFNEVVAPDGFVKVTAITFTVSADGQVYVVHSDQNKVTSSRNRLTVIDDAVAKPIETPKGSLTVQKVDATSNAVLQGAVFSVVGNITETTSTVDSSKVDAALAAKQEEIAQLQAKLAELEETAKATDPGDAAAVEANRLAIENAQKALDTANNSYSALLIEKANLKPTVTSKTVTKDFGTVTTDANGVASLTELPDGEYSITETQAPAGYDLDSTPHVVTIKDGQASVASNTLVVTNSKIVTPTPQFDITIRKVDLGGSELAGAQIQVKQGDTVISEWTSTGQAQVVSLKPGTYTFHEVAAPNGYKVVTDITFSVDETGQVAILSARADEAKVAANELIVTDQKVQQPQEAQTQTPKTNNNKFKEDDTSKGSSSATEVVGNSGSNKVLPATNSTDLKGVVIAGFAFLIAGFVLAFFGKKKKA